MSSAVHPRKIILNGHATFVLVRRGYHSLSYSIRKLNHEYEKRLCKVGHCLQKSCGRTLFWLLSSLSNSKNYVLHNHAYNECFQRHLPHSCSIARLIILAATPHACRLNMTRLKQSTCSECVCQVNIETYIDKQIFSLQHFVCCIGVRWQYV